MGFFDSVKNFIRVAKEFNEEAQEAAKYNTRIYQGTLKDINNFAIKHNINNLCKNHMGWEEYDRKLLQIKEIDLSYKGLSELPYCILELIKEIEQLIYISLKGNDFECISYKYNILLHKTIVLDFSHNKISEIDDCFFDDGRKSHFRNTMIKHIDLSFNKIEKIPLYLSFNNSLVHLDLSHNNIHRCYDSLCYNLEHIDLSYNNLTFFSVSSIEKLKILKINNNKIDHKLPFKLKKIFEHKASSFEDNPIANYSEPFEKEIIFEEKSYINICFNCKSRIDSRRNKQCSVCKFYICYHCGYCFCKKKS